MKFSRRKLGLPLFTKELIEQAARRRTYGIRIVYAAILFVYGFIELNTYLSRYGQSFQILGTGQQIFSTLVQAQFVGIYIFMPAMVAGAIAGEKEKNTLVSLMITRLGPMTILFEKMLSRVVPMMTMLLISTPLLAFAYSLGGVTQLELWGSIWLLFLTCIQVASFSLMCSAFCSTTVSAFFATYMLGLFFMFPFTACISASYMGGPGAGNMGSGVIVHTVVLLFTSAVFFMLSLAFLVERALVEPRNFLLDFFKGLDRFFVNLNDATTGGIVVLKDAVDLPQDEAIGWRETSKKSLGTIRYLVRVLVSIEMPLLLVLTIVTGNRNSGADQMAAMTLLAIVWTITALLVAVKSTTLISSERSHQTFDVMLTMPMSGQEIIREKFRGVHRLITVMAVPFATIFFFQLWWSGFRIDIDNFNYLLCSVLSVVCYLPLIAWISFWIGIKIKSQARAILASILILSAWTLLPLIAMGGWMQYQFGFLSIFSPATILMFNEVREATFLWTALHFLCFAGMISFLRSVCLARADEYLGRCGDGTVRVNQKKSTTVAETAPAQA